MFTTFLVGLSLQAVGGDKASIDRCWANESRNGINVRVYKGHRNCVDLAPATEMDGVWVNEFEGSAFYEGARSIADVSARKSTGLVHDRQRNRSPPRLHETLRVSVPGEDRGPESEGHASTTP